MDRHQLPMGDSIQWGHLEAQILCTVRKQDLFPRACYQWALGGSVLEWHVCVFPPSRDPRKEEPLVFPFHRVGNGAGNMHCPVFPCQMLGNGSWGLKPAIWTGDVAW